MLLLLQGLHVFVLLLVDLLARLVDQQSTHDLELVDVAFGLDHGQQITSF